jgi:hypothetical protein
MSEVQRCCSFMGPLGLSSSGLQEQGRSRKGTVTIHSTRLGGCLAHSSNILIMSRYYSPARPSGCLSHSSHFNILVVWCSLPGCAVEMDEHAFRGSYTVAKLDGWEIGNVSLRHCITLWVVPSGSPHLLSLHTVANLAHMATNSRECTFFKNEEFEHDNLLLR